MIKLKNILYEGGKLFAPHSDRVTTDEMQFVIKKMEEKVGDLFKGFQPVKSLKSKTTHGDVDLLVLPKIGNWKDKVEERLKDEIIDNANSGNVHSYLIYSPDLDKKVHVDFIVAGSEQKLQSMSDYYIYNDFSGVIGIFAKHLNFKYGDEGFFKRYKDKRGQWHNIFLTSNLMDGLEILGYKNPKEKVDKMETLDDVVNFVIDSPLMDVDYFIPSNMNVSQRKDANARENIKYIIDQIRKIKPKATLYDENNFLKILFPQIYKKLQNEESRIEKETYAQSKYSGKWLIDTFGLKPGPIVGDILRQITKKFGDNLDEVPEEEVIQFVKELL